MSNRVLQISDLQPLYSCRALISLNFSAVRCASNLCDGDLEDMAKAWPKLQDLHLFTQLKWPQTTLKGLESLAIHCPEIQRVSLAIDGTIPVERDTRALPSKASPLSILRVNRSPVSDPAPVASFLSSLFPRLESVVCLKEWDWETHGNPSVERQGRWESVERMMLDGRGNASGDAHRLRGEPTPSFIESKSSLHRL